MINDKFIEHLSKETKERTGYDIRTNIDDISEEAMDRLITISKLAYEPDYAINSNKPNDREELFLYELYDNDYLDYEIVNDRVLIVINTDKLIILYEH